MTTMTEEPRTSGDILAGAPDDVVLREWADALWRMQRDIVVLAGRFEMAIPRAVRDDLDEEGRDRLLADARRYLGPGEEGAA